MNGKVVSLFDHPEFARRAKARAERELAEYVAPVVRLGRGSFRCRRCSLEFETIPQLHEAEDARPVETCPHCDPPLEMDALEAFLNQVLREP